MNLIRCLISYFLLVTNLTVAYGQRWTKEISKVKTQLLNYESSRYPVTHSIPFKQIEVVDYRFDTTKIGYATHNRQDNHTRLTILGGVQYFLNSQLNEYFKDNLDPASSKTLVIVLKKLWLEYGSVNHLLNSKDINNASAKTLVNRNSVCLADIDVFARTDTGFKALIRLTTNFVIEKFRKYSDFYLLMMPFDSLISKLQSMDVEATLASKRNFSSADIHVNYSNRFAIPVLSADSIARGIFLSFDDFRNNKASYPDFMYKISELSTDVTVVRDGKPVAITEYWGFNDGKDLFIRPGFVPFRVMRQGNTFDMLGSLTSATRYDFVPLPLPGIPLATVPVNFIPGYPLQVDMETGKVY